MQKHEQRYWEYALPVPAELGDLMAHFMVYGDESGKLSPHSDYMSFCGYVGSALEWERMSMQWNNTRLAWGVPPLHMRCVMFPERGGCESWNGVKDLWGKDWEEKRNDMLLEFGSLIRYSTLASVGSVVDAAHFRSLPDSRFKTQYRDPILLGFLTLLMKSIERVDHVSKSLSISLVADDEEQYSMECYKLLNDAREQLQSVRERISAVTFGNDNEYPGLQMADMIAYEARSFMVSQLSGKDTPPSELFGLLTRMGANTPLLWTAEYIDERRVIPRALLGPATPKSPPSSSHPISAGAR